MFRIGLLSFGLLLVLNQYYGFAISVNFQSVFFISGVVIVGLPHGAADLLISIKESMEKKQSFSSIGFFIKYIGLLLAFLLLLIFVPSVGLILFIIISAFHFGETDLYQFKTESLRGRLFVISYGLLIINVILLNHIGEIKPLLLLLNQDQKHLYWLSIIDHYKLLILALSATFFFLATFFFFLSIDYNPQINGRFLVSLALIILTVYNLPMLLGFTFYFVLWHSLLSLRKIFSYLHDDGAFSYNVIFKQIGLYSLIAFAGTIILGLTGFMFASNNSMIIYLFMSLAVLTAPHMQIMHSMYKNLRTRVPLQSLNGKPAHPI
jgi:Brp/Blh family beta-carotene 15,15'-monooxygenase